jgi:hypothetical protein
VAALAARQPEDQAEHEAQQDHGREGREDRQARPIDDDIAGQAPEGQFAQPRPQQADGGDQQSDGD